MVNQIPVPQAKYALLSAVRQNRHKSLVFLIFLTIIALGLFFVSGVWFDIYRGASWLSNSPLETEVKSSIWHSSATNCSDNHCNAKIAAWLRRARMYAESAKKDQNANRISTIAESDQHSRRATSQIVVCYYTIPRCLNSSWELGPSHLDPRICTHIIVGFASVVNSTISLGNNSDIYKKVADLKNQVPKLKVMISAGGMDELQSGFPEMVKNHANRKRFIRSVLDVTKNLNLDGLDVDWEFPAWSGGNPRQKIYFVQLLQQLRKEFDRSGRKLLLSVAVASPAAIIDQSYNVPQIVEHVDFVSLMSYDYHMYVWYFPLTGHNSPLYPRIVEQNNYVGTLNVNYSAMYWLAKGMPREKFVIGVPTYGHNYQLDNPLNHGVSSPAKGIGKLGEDGFVSYPVVCDFIDKGATRRFDNESKVPYAYHNDEWISYDDPVSISQKAEWIKENGFGGAMVFSLNEDDWKASCPGTASNDTFPLTRTIFEILRGTRLN